MKISGTFWLLLSCMTMLLACGPEQDNPKAEHELQPEVRKSAKINYAGALERLEALEKSLHASDAEKSLALIDELKKSFAISFPMDLPKPFSLHSLQDLLMKNTRAIKDKQKMALTTAWQNLLHQLDKQLFRHDTLKFLLDISVLNSVLSGTEPQLLTQLHEDFSSLRTAEQRKERDSISLESFWQRAFLYNSGSGYTSEQDTGAVVVTDGGKMVGILEFKNNLAAPRPIDLTSQRDLTDGISKTPGYVSSVGRRAAYARFDVGKKMFSEFFKYAKDKHIAESYLHVRADNSAAIKLYESLGYKEVATVPGYYSANPRIDALVMLKKF